MNAKEYLNQAYKLNSRINSKLEQLEVLKSLSMKVTSCFSDVKVMHSKNEKSQMEKNLVQIVDLSVEINDEINELIRLKSEIAETIREVDDVNCELLLVKRYISGKSWEEIAEEMQYSISGIFRIHGEALKKINKILKRQKKSV
jgi:DNA-directed RNA polymerase specialized sigma subunit